MTSRPGFIWFTGQSPEYAGETGRSPQQGSRFPSDLIRGDELNVFTVKLTGPTVGLDQPCLSGFFFRESVKTQKKLLCQLGSVFRGQAKRLMFNGLGIHVVTSSFSRA